MGSFGGKDGTAGGGTGNGSKYYNGGEVGKWHETNASGGGFGGNGGTLGGINDIYINGNTSLDVTGYTFNGTTYSDLKEFTKAILENGTTEDVFYVDFNVNGETSPRTARVRANGAANPGDDITIDYQYKLTYTVPSVGGTASATQEVFFYKRDGATINLPVLSDSVYTNQGGIDYHANKWDVQGQKVSGGNVRINATGDATISNITQVADTSYGFRTSDNALVVNQTSGTVSVNTAGGKTISKIELPSSGSVALDLSETQNFMLAGTSSTSGGIINPTSLTSVKLPETNFSIGQYAFLGCTELSGLTNLSNCTSIAKNAFTGCEKLTTLDLSNCSSIGNGVFQNCTNLKTVILKSDLTEISGWVFDGCTKLENIIIPSTCTKIGASAFRNCTALKSVDLSHCTEIKELAFKNCTSLTGTINLSNCTSLAEGVFYDCEKITNVVLGNGITSIPKSAFFKCVNLGNINLSQCTDIGEEAFRYCISLSNVDLSNCISIGSYAFHSSDPTVAGGIHIDATHPGLTGAVDLSDCQTIEKGAFRFNSNITSVDLSGCSVVKELAFSMCTTLTSVTFGSNLTSIEGGAFHRVSAVFVFANDPTGFTYTNFIDAEGNVSYTFQNGATATWNGNTYTWNASANSGNGAWDPF